MYATFIRPLLHSTQLVLASAALLLGIATVAVAAEKTSAQAEDRIYVNTKDVAFTEADFGVPFYPGAKLLEDRGSRTTASGHLVYIAVLRTTDKKDKVLAFYRGKLAACRYFFVYELPKVGPMLDLLVCDAEHPRALAFQSRAIARDLETLATSLGITGEMGLDEAIPQLTEPKLAALEAEGAEADQARRSMAERLRALSWAAGQLSDRLSLRHFSHISQDAQALAT